MKMVLLVFLVRAQVIIMQEREEGFLSQDQEGEKRDPSSFSCSQPTNLISDHLSARSYQLFARKKLMIYVGERHD